MLRPCIDRLLLLAGVVGLATRTASCYEPIGQEQAVQAVQLGRLEQEYSSIRDELTELKMAQEELAEAQEAAVKPNAAATMSLSGRIHVDYWAFPDTTPGINAFETLNPAISPQDRFGFRRIRLAASGTLPADMLYKAEIEFADPSGFEYRDVYLGWEELPLFQTLLVGNQKRPYGLDHLNSSRFNIFMERPFIVEAFNQDARRLGVASYGVSEDAAYNWRYGFYNLRLTQDEGIYVGDHYQPEFAGRLANTLWYDEATEGRNYVHAAASGSVANPDGAAGIGPVIPGFGRAANEARFRTRPEARSTTRWLDTLRIPGAELYGLLGAESVVNIGPLQLGGEYMNVWLGREDGFGDGLHFHGGYVYLAYVLTGEHVPWQRDTGTIGRLIPFEHFYFAPGRGLRPLCGWGAWQVAVRWSRADLTDQDVAGGIGQSVTLGINWYWSPNAKMQFNYIYGDIHDHFPIAGETFGTYQIAGARWLVDF